MVVDQGRERLPRRGPRAKPLQEFGLARGRPPNPASKIASNRSRSSPSRLFPFRTRDCTASGRFQSAKSSLASVDFEAIPGSSIPGVTSRVRLARPGGRPLRYPVQSPVVRLRSSSGPRGDVRSCERLVTGSLGVRRGTSRRAPARLGRRGGRVVRTRADGRANLAHLADQVADRGLSTWPTIVRRRISTERIKAPTPRRRVSPRGAGQPAASIADPAWDLGPEPRRNLDPARSRPGARA